MSRAGTTARILAAAIAAAGALAFAGCAADDGGETLPPVIADLGEIDGTTVKVDTGNTVDLVGDEKSFTDWTAEIADPAVAEFVPGSDDGTLQTNPGIDALAPGKTEVTLDNGATGDSVTFTVAVADPR